MEKATTTDAERSNIIYFPTYSARDSDAKQKSTRNSIKILKNNLVIQLQELCQTNPKRTKNHQNTSTSTQRRVFTYKVHPKNAVAALAQLVQEQKASQATINVIRIPVHLSFSTTIDSVPDLSHGVEPTCTFVSGALRWNLIVAQHQCFKGYSAEQVYRFLPKKLYVGEEDTCTITKFH